MAPRTSQLLGLSNPELYAATFTALGEAGPGLDPFGVFSTILTRKQTGKYGKDIVGIVKAPSQFVANDPYSTAQVTDPKFGRKIYGSRYDQMLQKLEDPSQLIPILQKHGGALEFRGQSLLKNKRPEDVMFDPGGNYYFGKDPKAQQALLNRLQSGSGFAPPAPTLPPATATATPREKGNGLGASILNLIKNTGLGTMFRPQSALPGYDEILGTTSDPQAYLQAFANRLMEGEEV